jgi:3-dehydroquinate dehydratase-1
MLEFRADCYEDCFNKDVLTKALNEIKRALPDKPLLFTFRTKSEGGNTEATDSQYKELLKTAIESEKIDLIDVEYFMGAELVADILNLAHEHGIYVIMSNHDFKTTIPMEQIVARYKDMIEAGADIAKIAMMPEEPSQVVDMMQAAKELQESGNETPLVVISMGEMGVETRTTGEMYGNSISFGAVGNLSAPGQIEAGALHEQLKSIHNIINSMQKF